MKSIKYLSYLLISAFMLLVVGCNYKPSQTAKDSAAVERQQNQYSKGQPIPSFDYSLEREAVIKLYMLRNKRVLTSTVWRSNSGMIEGTCPSMGYGIPYDTSLTNPFKLTHKYVNSSTGRISGVVGQAEPNGIFASANTSATWVMCIGNAGNLEPIYVESKVTTYPYPIKVDYDKNRVYKLSDSKNKFRLNRR